jgi:glutathione S-transferase
MSKATLYHVPKTISSPIVQVLLEMGACEVDIVTLDFAGLKSPSHLAINPMGSSPAFQDGDLKMWESGAVLLYLLETYDTSHAFHPPPGTGAPRGKFFQIQQYIIATVYPFISSLYIHTLKPIEEQDLVYVETAKGKWRALLGPTLVKALGGGPYLLGQQRTAIDFLICKPLNNIKAMGMLSETPTLEALFTTVSSLPSFSQAYDNHAAPLLNLEKRCMVLVPGGE